MWGRDNVEIEYASVAESNKKKQFIFLKYYFAGTNKYFIRTTYIFIKWMWSTAPLLYRSDNTKLMFL